MKEKMTVHEALSELKTLNKRVEKAISDSSPIAYKEHGATKISGKDVKCTVERIVSDHNSAIDLINRMAAIKAAINQYNAEKHITVGDKDYTVAQAIYMMQYGLQYKRDLVATYTQALHKATAFVERSNGDQLNNRAEAAMNAIYGAKEKSDPAAYLKGLMDYKEQHTVELVDPLNLEKVIEKLGIEIDAFTSRVDSAIQIANATTEIEFEY